ncbi:MAG: HAD family hydrolase [Roseburia sp.]
MIQGAIFDLDGTLLDSMSVWDTIGEDYLRSLGMEPKENLRETFQAFTLEQSAEYYREHYGVTLSVTEIIKNVNAMVENYYIEIVPLKPGVKELLTKLHNHGVKMCIATATDRYLAEAALKRCGVRKFFSEIFTCAQVGKSKEDPGIYHAALEHLGTDKTQTVVFEDACYALKTAKADGFVAAAVYDAYEDNQKEMRAISDFYIDDFSDIDVFLNSISK